MSVETVSRSDSSRERRITELQKTSEGIYRRAQEYYEGIFLLDEFSPEQDLEKRQEGLIAGQRETLRKFLEAESGSAVKSQEAQKVYFSLAQDAELAYVKSAEAFSFDEYENNFRELFERAYPGFDQTEADEAFNQFMVLTKLKIQHEKTIAASHYADLKAKYVERASLPRVDFGREALEGIKSMPMAIAMMFQKKEYYYDDEGERRSRMISPEYISIEDTLEQGVIPRHAVLAKEVFNAYKRFQIEAETADLETGAERNEFIMEQLGKFVNKFVPPEGIENQSQSVQLQALVRRINLWLRETKRLIPSPTVVGIPEQLVDKKNVQEMRTRIAHKWIEDELEEVQTDEQTHKEARSLLRFWGKQNRMDDLKELDETSPEDFSKLFNAQELYFSDGPEAKLAASKEFAQVLIDHYLLFFKSDFLHKDYGLDDLRDVDPGVLIKEAQKMTEEVQRFFSDLDIVTAGFTHSNPLVNEDQKELERYIYNYAFARINEDQLIVKMNDKKKAIHQLEDELAFANRSVRDLRRKISHGMLKNLTTKDFDEMEQGYAEKHAMLVQEIQAQKEALKEEEEAYHKQIMARMKNVQ